MLIEAEGIIGFVLFALWIWALIDCISTDSELVRNLPKGVWLIIVIFLFDLGAILWLLLGRPANKALASNHRPGRLLRAASAARYRGPSPVRRR